MSDILARPRSSLPSVYRARGLRIDIKVLRSPLLDRQEEVLKGSRIPSASPAIQELIGSVKGAFSVLIRGTDLTNGREYILTQSLSRKRFAM